MQVDNTSREMKVMFKSFPNAIYQQIFAELVFFLNLVRCRELLRLYCNRLSITLMILVLFSVIQSD